MRFFQFFQRFQFGRFGIVHQCFQKKPFRKCNLNMSQTKPYQNTNCGRKALKMFLPRRFVDIGGEEREDWRVVREDRREQAQKPTSKRSFNDFSLRGDCGRMIRGVEYHELRSLFPFKIGFFFFFSVL